MEEVLLEASGTHEFDCSGGGACLPEIVVVDQQRLATPVSVKNPG